MDHHCVWVNNCVGAGNGKFFLQFICAAFLYNATYAITGVVALLNCLGFYGDYSLLSIETADAAEAVGPSHKGAVVAMVFYELFALVFVYFTWDFYDDFLFGVDRNQTTVENYKERYGIQVRECHRSGTWRT